MKSKKDIIKSLAINEKDVGSTAVQIGLLSDKIEKLAVHFKKFIRDGFNISKEAFDLDIKS